MTKLTDTQLVILNAAAGRDDRAVLPLPKSLKVNKGAATTVLKTLLKKGLVEETPAALGDEHWREDDAGHKLVLTITDAGLAGLDEEPAKPTSRRTSKRSGVASKNGTPTGKAGTILALLKRPEGAPLADLERATGWQPHSIRAALTGLRKRGITITRSKDDGVTIYRAERV